MKKLWLVFVLFLVGCASNPSPTPPAALKITTTSLPNAQISAVYAEQLQASGGTAPYTWLILSGSLPAGVTLSASGVLAGVPTVAGSSVFVVEVKDASSTTAQLQISNQSGGL